MLRDSSGRILRVTLDEQGRDCRPTYAADPDDWIVKALVAAEDGEFWRHCGVRPGSVLRAAWQNLRGGRRVSGASTITMQAVRLIRPHPKTFLWKAREAVMAVKMERERDKLWIVSQYLNRAPFGANLVGIEAAAEGWFGHPAKSLGLGEAALLAGIVQAPSRFRPDRSLDRALARRDYVLARMLALGLADADQVAAAKAVRPRVVAERRPFLAPHYCDWALAAGVDGSALDPEAQEICERAVASASRRGGYDVAAVVVRAADGEVEAMASSGDYFGGGACAQVNTAVARRSAGSTLKPFLAELAMELGYAEPGDLMDDSPRDYSGWRPQNFDGRFRGEVTMRDALVMSLNIPFIDLLSRIGVDRFAGRLVELGFAGVKAPFEDYGLGLAVGDVEVSLLELARAYRRFAPEDLATNPEPRITNHGPRTTSYAVYEMLSGPERSQPALGHVADALLPRFAWKTGTSSDWGDAWTILWDSRRVVAVWCGHAAGGYGDETVVGLTAAAPVAWSIARGLQ